MQYQRGTDRRGTSFFKCCLCRATLKKNTDINVRFPTSQIFSPSERKIVARKIDTFRFEFLTKLIANTKSMLFVEEERAKYFMIPKVSSKRVLDKKRPEIVARLTSNEALPLLHQNMKLVKMLDKCLLKVLNSIKKPSSHLCYDTSTDVARMILKMLKAKRKASMD